MLADISSADSEREGITSPRGIDSLICISDGFPVNIPLGHSQRSVAYDGLVYLFYTLNFLIVLRQKQDSFTSLILKRKYRLNLQFSPEGKWCFLSVLFHL